jgi:hypothetical protein
VAAWDLRVRRTLQYLHSILRAVQIGLVSTRPVDMLSHYAGCQPVEGLPPCSWAQVFVTRIRYDVQFVIDLLAGICDEDLWVQVWSVLCPFNVAKHPLKMIFFLQMFTETSAFNAKKRQHVSCVIMVKLG